jgi:hypothetical protein
MYNTISSSFARVLQTSAVRVRGHVVIILTVSHHPSTVVWLSEYRRERKPMAIMLIHPDGAQIPLHARLAKSKLIPHEDPPCFGVKQRWKV